MKYWAEGLFASDSIFNEVDLVVLNFNTVWLLLNFLWKMLRELLRRYAYQLYLLYRLVSVCLDFKFLRILLIILFVCILFHQEAINQGPEILSKSPSRQLTIHIDRFAYIFRCVR